MPNNKAEHNSPRVFRTLGNRAAGAAVEQAVVVDEAVGEVPLLRPRRHLELLTAK